MAEIGEFSSIRSEFSAIGGAVNLAAHLQAQAAAGEVLLSAETAALAPALAAGAPQRTLALKGIGDACRRGCWWRGRRSEGNGIQRRP